MDQSEIRMIFVQSGCGPETIEPVKQLARIVATKPGWGLSFCYRGIPFGDAGVENAILAGAPRHFGYIGSVNEAYMLPQGILFNCGMMRSFGERLEECMLTSHAFLFLPGHEGTATYAVTAATQVIKGRGGRGGEENLPSRPVALVGWGEKKTLAFLALLDIKVGVDGGELPWLRFFGLDQIEEAVAFLTAVG